VTTATDTPPAHPVLDGLDAIIEPLENLYRDLHTHPELSDQERRNAAKAAEQLEGAGCEVSTGVGGTGVVGVLRIGSLQAGTKGNVIPDEAVLKINVRSFDDGVRARVLAAIKRIVTEEATASGAREPPSFRSFDHFDLTVNDPATATHVGDAFRAYFGTDRVTELTDPLPVSEDFGLFGEEWKVPSLFWYVGGTDPDV
jgi:metal-dependent amidase/aminoacylase/carboxypeptidase family protein